MPRRRSLHARMLALSIAATGVALLLAAWAIGGVLGRVVTEGIDRRLDAEIALLATAIGVDGRIDRARIVARAAVLDDGPGWRWRIESRDGAFGSTDLPIPDDPVPDGPAPPPAPRTKPDERARLHPIEGHDSSGEGYHARQVVIGTPRGPVTITAAAPRDVIRRPLRGALMPLLALLVALAVLLTAAALVQLRVGLRPVRRLRDQLAAIRAGQRTRVDEDQPSELQPLAQELNALAEGNAAALANARATAANLAHALKTPVAALALELRDRPDAARQVARIDATIRHHLARARAEATDLRASTDLSAAIADIGTAVQRLHGDRAVSIEVTGAESHRVAVDRHDLDEMLGNLLDNAARHAARMIRVIVSQPAGDARRLTITVADDGPGIAAAERERVAQPGVRLDERGDGHGFGLAIAGDLAARYGGTLVLDSAEGGGLAARLTLPSVIETGAGAPATAH